MKLHLVDKLWKVKGIRGTEAVRKREERCPFEREWERKRLIMEVGWS